jgi:hypothetical protein
LPAPSKLVDQFHHGSHQPIHESKIRPSIAEKPDLLQKTAKPSNTSASEHNPSKVTFGIAGQAPWQIARLQRQPAWLAYSDRQEIF